MWTFLGDTPERVQKQFRRCWALTRVGYGERAQLRMALGSAPPAVGFPLSDKWKAEVVFAATEIFWWGDKKANHDELGPWWALILHPSSTDWTDLAPEAKSGEYTMLAWPELTTAECEKLLQALKATGAPKNREEAKEEPTK